MQTIDEFKIGDWVIFVPKECIFKLTKARLNLINKLPDQWSNIRLATDKEIGDNLLNFWEWSEKIGEVNEIKWLLYKLTGKKWVKTIKWTLED